MDGKIEGTSTGLAWARETERLQWAVRVRWAVIVGFGTLAVAGHPLGLFPDLWAVLLAGAVGMVGNGVNHLCVSRGRGVVLATIVALILDNLLIAWTCAWTGGFRSPMLLMFSVQVVATAMLVTAAAALLSAALAAVCLGALAAVDTGAIIGGAQLVAPTLLGSARGVRLEAIAWSACLAYGLFLLIFVGGFVSQRLRRREGELAAQNRHLELVNERLQQAEAQLVHSEKMRALGQLVAGVAHELNNPISFISANIEPLREAFRDLLEALDSWPPLLPAAESKTRRTALDRVVREVPVLLDDCAEGARRVKRIVSELRTFSHQGGDDDVLQPLDLNERLTQTLHLLRHHLTRGVKAETDLRPLPPIDGTPGQLDQVFLNLIVNAVEAVGMAGTIRVSSAHDTDAGLVRISVADDGPGISPANLERIFEPFFTTKPVGQGTGVGLSLSYAIVRRHGGRLSARSEGRGAIFLVEIPCTETLKKGGH